MTSSLKFMAALAGIGLGLATYAAAPEEQPARFAINPGQETVTDRQTGLVWARNADLPGGRLAWDEAVKYCKDLNAKSYLGYTAWRLPAVRELQQMKDTPLDAVFTNLQASFYWSGDAIANCTARACFLGRHYVYARNSAKTRKHCVWPVCNGK